MIELFSLEFWTGIQFIIDFFLVVLIFVLAKRINRIKQFKKVENQSGIIQDFRDAESESTRTANDILDMLEPLVQESKSCAKSFDRQIKEKKRLIKELNEALDSRIINVNILLSKAETLQRDLERQAKDFKQSISFAPSGSSNLSQDNLLDQQNSILDLFSKGFDIDAIAARLSVPKGEVELVVDLKKKFLAME